MRDRLTGRDRLIGLAILVVAIASAWGVVALGQAWGAGWIAAAIGSARMQAEPATVEALFTLIIFVPLTLIALAGGTIERRNPFAPGERPGAMLGLGLIVGLVGLSAAVLYANLAGAVAPGGAGDAMAGMLLAGLGIVAVQVLAEEVYFRGWLQPALIARWGAAAGIGTTALAFAVLHIAGGARAPVSLLNLALGGLMFGLWAWRGGGIAGAAGLHLGWNASEQLVYGVDPNPGIGGFGAIRDLELMGAPLWGGSADGLNGSLGMTIVLLAIIAPLALLVRRASPPQMAAATS